MGWEDRDLFFKYHIVCFCELRTVTINIDEKKES